MSPFASAYDDADARRDRAAASAAERFKSGLSSVSHGVLDNARRIPRNVWRIALLCAGAAVLLALVVWGCVALYKATEHGLVAPEPVAEVETESVAPAPAAQPKPKQTARKSAKPAQKAAPSALRSTGQKVPPLYVD